MDWIYRSSSAQKKTLQERLGGDWSLPVGRQRSELTKKVMDTLNQKQNLYTRLFRHEYEKESVQKLIFMRALAQEYYKLSDKVESMEKEAVFWERKRELMDEVLEARAKLKRMEDEQKKMKTQIQKLSYQLKKEKELTLDLRMKQEWDKDSWEKVQRSEEIFIQLDSAISSMDLFISSRQVSEANQKLDLKIKLPELKFFKNNYQIEERVEKICKCTQLMTRLAKGMVKYVNLTAPFILPEMKEIASLSQQNGQCNVSGDQGAYTEPLGTTDFYENAIEFVAEFLKQGDPDQTA